MLPDRDNSQAETGCASQEGCHVGWRLDASGDDQDDRADNRRRRKKIDPQMAGTSASRISRIVYPPAPLIPPIITAAIGVSRNSSAFSVPDTASSARPRASTTVRTDSGNLLHHVKREERS